ncbi:MAG: YidC/Oxa1 family membrane protein insertase [Acidimicrobiia bacterium]
MNTVLRVIGQPILLFLEWFYEYIPSLGLAIIALTIVVNTLVFPLVLKQTRATKAFQKIGPEIKKLQEKYKDEPQTLQTEMVKLQRENGATPGGCLLPMLVQLPIWWALFRVLQSIGSDNGDALFEVQEGFRLYDDLAINGSAHFLGALFGLDPSQGLLDLTTSPSAVWGSEAGFLALIPYFLLIGLMVGGQYFAQLVQQRYNEAGTNVADNPQAKQMQTITKVLPIMFGVFAWTFPAGLTVYWTTSSLVRLSQQRVINRLDENREAAKAAALEPPKPAASSDEQAGPEAPQKKPAKPQGSAKKQQRRRRRRS